MACCSCLSEKYSFKMAISKNCECHYVICYDCFNKAKKLNEHKKCFICKKTDIIAAMPRNDFDDCHERDTKFGPFLCELCDITIERRKYFQHLIDNHCEHQQCLVHRTECGNFPTCKFKLHIKDCQKCKLKYCNECFELIHMGHRAAQCSCGAWLIHCIKTNSYNSHQCQDIRVFRDTTIRSNKYCEHCYAEGQHTSEECKILSRMINIMETLQIRKENLKKVKELDEQLKGIRPIKMIPLRMTNETHKSYRSVDMSANHDIGQI